MNDRGWGGRQGKMADRGLQAEPQRLKVPCPIHRAQFCHGVNAAVQFLLRRAGGGRRGETHKHLSSGGIRSSAEKKEERSEAAIA